VSKDKEQRSNVIPLRRKEQTPRDKLKETLGRINRTMDELKQMAADQREVFPSEAVVTNAEQVQPSTLPSEEEMEREYRRKQDAAKKKRTSHNHSVTRDYNLRGPGKKPRK
jgi:hypothetical protein